MTPEERQLRLTSGPYRHGLICLCTCVQISEHCSKLYLSGMYVDSRGIQKHCKINLLIFSEWGLEVWGTGGIAQ